MMKQPSSTPHGEHTRRVRYEPSPDEPLSIAAATALAQYHGEAVTNASTRLYDYIDPDAIDALFAPTSPGRSTTAIELAVDDLTMMINADCVEVQPAAGTDY